MSTLIHIPTRRLHIGATETQQKKREEVGGLLRNFFSLAKQTRTKIDGRTVVVLVFEAVNKE